MASIFGHVAASTAIGLSFFPKHAKPAVLLLAGAAACVPDLDILAFNFGIPYNSPWGHRGASHSILFAAFFGLFLAAVFYRNDRNFWRLALLFFVCTLSHPLLDACTTGGRGVALFFPFDNSRIFFPWRVIQVSPISPGDFFGEWGLEVLVSECYWIGLPGIFLVLVSRLFRFLQTE